MGGTLVEIEAHALHPPAGVTACAYAVGMLSHYRGLFEYRFGPVLLEDEGWTIRLMASSTVHGEGTIGVTYHQERVIDLAAFSMAGQPWTILPHELRHVQLGGSSGDHHGWCLDYYPWARDTLGIDESAYLGCEVLTVQ